MPLQNARMSAITLPEHREPSQRTLDCDHARSRQIARRTRSNFRLNDIVFNRIEACSRDQCLVALAILRIQVVRSDGLLND